MICNTYYIYEHKQIISRKIWLLLGFKFDNTSNTMKRLKLHQAKIAWRYFCEQSSYNLAQARLYEPKPLLIIEGMLTANTIRRITYDM